MRKFRPLKMCRMASRPALAETLRLYGSQFSSPLACVGDTVALGHARSSSSVMGGYVIAIILSHEMMEPGAGIEPALSA